MTSLRQQDADAAEQRIDAYLAAPWWLTCAALVGVVAFIGIAWSVTR